MNKLWDEWICDFADDDIVVMTDQTSEDMISFEIEDRKYFLEQTGEEGLLAVKFSAAVSGGSNVQEFVEKVSEIL